MAPCIVCGRPVCFRFQRCGTCANTPPNLTVSGLRHILAKTQERTP